MDLVALQARLPQFETPVESQAKVLQLRQLMNADQVSGLEIDQRRQALADDAAVRQAYANNTDPAERLKALALASPKAYQAEVKARQEAEKNTSEVDYKKAQTRSEQLKSAHSALEIAGQQMQYVFQNPTLENANAVLDKMQQLGVYAPEDVAKIRAQVTANPDPAHIKSLAEQGYRGALSAKDQLPTIVTRNVGGTTETDAFDPITGQRRNLASVVNTQSPDSIATNARIAAEGRKNRSNDKMQVLQTDSGPVLVNKTTGETSPITSNGEPLAARAKEVPAAIKKSMFENDAALRKIDDALAAIDEHPEAIGAMNILGDTVRQRTDPKGVKARALVADIGSLKLHDRSGAAVTASETPRLKPFIPSATDDIDTVRQKLDLFRREYQAVQDDMLAAYPAAAAAKRSAGATAKPAAKPAPAAPALPSGWSVEVR